MATLVCFHAHPDDEAIATGGSIRLAADAGHRVVLVIATGGELGEVAEGVLGPGESLADRRRVEQEEAARLLGVARVEWLGYRDSGMAGEPTNEHPDCFWRADVDEVAPRLAAILREEQADILTCYDDHGGYGHPDHVQVHRVGHRAAAVAGTPRIYEATMNRDRVLELQAAARAQGLGLPGDGGGDEPDGRLDLEGLGTPDELITTAIDVSGVIGVKRAAMVAHASQIPEDSFFLRLPGRAFEMAFGTEWFIRVGAPPRPRETSLFEGLS